MTFLLLNFPFLSSPVFSWWPSLLSEKIESPRRKFPIFPSANLHMGSPSCHRGGRLPLPILDLTYISYLNANSISSLRVSCHSFLNHRILFSQDNLTGKSVRVFLYSTFLFPPFSIVLLMPCRVLWRAICYSLFMSSVFTCHQLPSSIFLRSVNISKFSKIIALPILIFLSLEPHSFFDPMISPYSLFFHLILVIFWQTNLQMLFYTWIAYQSQTTATAFTRHMIFHL